MEFEFKIKVRGQKDYAYQTVDTNVDMINDRSILRLEYRACRKVMYSQRFMHIFGTDLWAVEFRCRPTSKKYRKLDESNLFWTKVSEQEPWTEWTPMPLDSKRDKFADED